MVRRSKKGKKQQPRSSTQQADRQEQPCTQPARKDFYEVLGLPKQCSTEDIKKAYKTLALQYHPDKNPSPEAGEQFQLISTAYSVLSDPSKREYYDQHGDDGLEMMDISQDEVLHMFEEMFAEMFGGMAGIEAMLRGFSMSRPGSSRPRPAQRGPGGVRRRGRRGHNPWMHSNHASFPFHMGGFAAGHDDDDMDDDLDDAMGAALYEQFMLSMLQRDAGTANHHMGMDMDMDFMEKMMGGMHGVSAFENDSDDSWETDSETEDLQQPVQQQQQQQQAGSRANGNAQRDHGCNKQSPAIDTTDGVAAQDGSAQGQEIRNDTTQQDTEHKVLNPVGLSHQSTGSCDSPDISCKIHNCAHTMDTGSKADTQNRFAGNDLPETVPSSTHYQQPASRNLQQQQRSDTSISNVDTPANQYVCDEMRNPSNTAAQGVLDPGLVRDWMQASKIGDIDLLNHMLKLQPALLTAQGPGLGHTALHWSAARGHVPAIQFLLQKGLPVDIRNHEGSTPLHAAASNGQEEAVAMLIANGADVSATDDDGSTACELARRFKHLAVADLLSGPRYNNCSSTTGKVQHTMAGSQDSESCSNKEHKPFSQKNDAESETTIANHCNNDVEVSVADSKLPQLGTTPADETAAGQSSSESCVDPGFHRKASNADVRARRRAQLLAEQEAADAKEDSRIRASAAAAASVGVEPSQGRAWLQAAQAGCISDMKRLLDANPALLHYQGQGTSLSFSGHTALHWTAAKGHDRAVLWLLQHGASPNSRNNADSTPLHAAASNMRPACIECLVLQGGADAQATDDLGDTPRDILLRANRENSYKLAQRLDIYTRVHSLRTAQPSTWPLRSMRTLLSLAGIDTSGVLERQDLIRLVQDLIASLPAPTQHEGSKDHAQHRSKDQEDQHEQEQQPVEAYQGMSNSDIGTSSHCVAAGIEIGEDRKSEQQLPSKASQVPTEHTCAVNSSTHASIDPTSGTNDTGGFAGSNDTRGMQEEKLPNQAHVAEAKQRQSSCVTENNDDACSHQVEAAKVKGNQAFAAGDYQKAISHYSMAIRLCDGPCPVLYSNRAAAYASISHYVKSLEDADEAVRQAPGMAKAHSRRGAALLGSRRFEDARQAYERAIQIDAQYTAAIEGLRAAQKGLRSV